MISGRTRIIAHIGVPTESFKAPLIYNPFFEANGIDVAVVPLGCEPDNLPELMRSVSRLRNFAGALITMPHKVAAATLLDDASRTVEACGACNAVKRSADGHLIGEMFDGAGFVRGMAAQDRSAADASALIVGAGGVGSAISAALAEAGARRLGLFDIAPDRADALANRLRRAFPHLDVETGGAEPSGWGIAVNATPLGMNRNDSPPMNLDLISSHMLVGEVVLRDDDTPLLAAARAKGCAVVTGLDMLFEQIPAYLDFFELPSATPDELRRLARISQ